MQSFSRSWRRRQILRGTTPLGGKAALSAASSNASLLYRGGSVRPYKTRGARPFRRPLKGEFFAPSALLRTGQRLSATDRHVYCSLSQRWARCTCCLNDTHPRGKMQGVGGRLAKISAHSPFRQANTAGNMAINTNPPRSVAGRGGLCYTERKP